jgi:hypothetical protein
MTALAIISLIIGTALGLRFKVFILVPASLLAIAVGVAGIFTANLVAGVFVIVLCINLGYLGATAINLIAVSPTPKAEPVAGAISTTVEVAGH